MGDIFFFFFFSSRRRHTRSLRDWSSDVCSSDLAMAGRQLPIFSVIVPFWLVWAFAGWRGVLGIWPAVLVAGGAFAVPQFLISNLHGPWLVDVVSALISMGAVTLFLRVWRPRQHWGADGKEAPP